MVQAFHILSIGFLLAPSAVVGDEVTDSRPTPSRQSLEAFAAANAKCTEWSDGCIVCSRRDGQGFACSTPGIACRPSGLACQDAGRGAR